MKTSTHNAHATLDVIGWISTVLVVIGAINWGLIGFFHFNLVAAIFGDMTPIARLVYILVGLSGLYLVYFASALARRASVGAAPLGPFGGERPRSTV